MVVIVKANDGALFNLIKIGQFVIDDLGPGGLTKLLQQAAANLLDNGFALSGFGWANAIGFGPAGRAAIANDGRPAVQPIHRHTGDMPRRPIANLQAELIGHRRHATHIRAKHQSDIAWRGWQLTVAAGEGRAKCRAHADKTPCYGEPANR